MKNRTVAKMVRCIEKFIRNSLAIDPNSEELEWYTDVESDTYYSVRFEINKSYYEIGYFYNTDIVEIIEKRSI